MTSTSKRSLPGLVGLTLIALIFTIVLIIAVYDSFSSAMHKPWLRYAHWYIHMTAAAWILLISIRGIMAEARAGETSRKIFFHALDGMLQATLGLGGLVYGITTLGFIIASSANTQASLSYTFLVTLVSLMVLLGGLLMLRSAYHRFKRKTSGRYFYSGLVLLSCLWFLSYAAWGIASST